MLYRIALLREKGKERIHTLQEVLRHTTQVKPESRDYAGSK